MTTHDQGQGGAEVASDLLERYAPLGAHGQPVHQSFVQLRAAVRQRLGARHAALFTRPVRDPHDRLIRWFAEIPGQPVHFYDLPAAEQTRLSLEILALKADFQSFIAELRQARGASAAGSHAFATVLEQALIVPDDRHLYFIGDQPLATFWGFRDGGGGTEVLALGPRQTPGVAAPAAAAMAATVAPPPRRSWWWWLLLPLLLLLLLLGLSFCTPRLALDVPGLGALPLPGVDPQGHWGVALEGARLIGTDTITGAVEAGADASGAAPQASGQDAPPTGPDQPPQDQGQNNRSPDTSDHSQPGQPPAAAGPLRIPPAALAGGGGVGFMKGNWKSTTGLYDETTRQPLAQAYRFGADGSGQAVIRRPDGVECTAPATAKMVDGALVVEEQADPRCPDGRSFGRSRTRCTAAGGTTTCQGENADGSTFKVGIEKAP